jgi:hypothetical protein
MERLLISSTAALAHLAEVLANAVEDDDGVVQRVADDGEHGGEHGQVELDLEDREDADGEEHVVDQRGDGAEGEAPLEAHRDVDQDADQREQHRQPALLAQFLAHLRADELHPAQLDLTPSAAWFSTRTTSSLRCALSASPSTRPAAAGSGCPCATEVLHGGASGSRSRSERGADLATSTGLGVAEFDDRTAGEVEPEVEAAERASTAGKRQQHDAGQRSRRCTACP